MKKIIGLGTGRCGTVSFTNLINNQKGFKATHETFHSVANWNFSRIYFEKLVNYLNRGYSDISLYNLSYVIPLSDRFNALKFVCLKRDKEETIKSYMKKTDTTSAGAPRNHWTARDSKHWQEFPWRLDSIWDKCYPKFDLPKEKAIAAYWDLYYEIAKRFEKKLPERFKIYDMYLLLNNDVYQEDLFNFLEINKEDRKFIVGKKLNVGT